MTTPDKTLRDASSRFVWPPVIYALAVVGGYAGNTTVNAAVFPQAMAPAMQLAGLAAIAGGVGIALWAEIAFLRAGTATLPIHPSSTIVSSGIYRYSRNPMYLGMSLFTAGLALAFNSAWYLAALACAIIAVTRLAIVPEEKYLERKFGQSYLDYKARVRRWL
jgi:protein-S-isoprenylcysteine O-methyltransferase Ste14